MGRTYTYRTYHPNRRRRQLQIGAVAFTVSASGLLPLLPHPVEPSETPLFGQTTPLSQHSALAPNNKGKGGSQKDKDDYEDSDSTKGSDSSGSSSPPSDSSTPAAGPATATASPVGNATSPASSPPVQPSPDSSSNYSSSPTGSSGSSGAAKSSGGLTMLAAPPTDSAPIAKNPTAGSSSAAAGSPLGGSSLPVSAPAAAPQITNTATSNDTGCQAVSADQLSQVLNSAQPGQLLCLYSSPGGALPPSTATAAPVLPQVAPSTSPAAPGSTSTSAGAAPTTPAPVTVGGGGGTWTMHVPFLSGCYTVPNTASDKSGQAPEQVRVCGSDADSGSKR